MSEARISKWSKSIEQLHSNRWSDTAGSLTHLRCFSVKLKIPMCSAAQIKKVAVCFTIVSNLAVTTPVSVNNGRADPFLKGIFMKQWISLHGDWKITLSLQNFKLLSIELTKQVFSCIDFFPRKGKGCK